MSSLAVVEIDDGAQAAALGGRIRHFRRARGLTLMALARETGLSQPFLSQVERGQARPGLASLGRICQALGIGRLELIVTPDDTDATGPEIGALLTADDGNGRTDLLLSGSAPFHVLRFEVINDAFNDFYRHDEAEFVYVLAGQIEIETSTSGAQSLTAGESLFYRGGTSHRWRRQARSRTEILVTKEPPLRSLQAGDKA